MDGKSEKIGLPPGQRKRKLNVVGDVATKPPVDRPKPRFRLTALPDQQKQIFVRNLNQLLDLIGVNRKTAAEHIQVPYRWLRRLVSAGISRTDGRNLDNLRKVASFFVLPEVEVFWTPHIVAVLIASEDGHGFVEKFGASISRLVQDYIKTSNRIDQVLVDAWTNSHAEKKNELAANYEAKLVALVATGGHDTLRQIDDACKRLVDEAYEREFGKGREKEVGTG